MSVRLLAAGALLLALAAANPLRADEAASALRPGEKVRTILAPGESRTLAIAGVAGTRCTIQVRAVGASRAVPRVDLVAPDGSALGDRGRFRDSAHATVARNLRIDSTGTWRATVSTSTVGGGEVEISCSARLPSLKRFKVVSSGEPPEATVEFGAVPGSTADVDVRLLGKSPPVFQAAVLGPSADGLTPGPEIAAAAGAAGRAELRDVALLAPGAHRVRVSGAAGTFRGSVRVKSPKRRPDLRFEDLEAFPAVSGLTPQSVENEGLRHVTLAGFGFSSRQRLTLKRNGATAASVTFVSFDEASARAVLDLEDVTPATYTASILLPSGRALELPWPVEVTNLPAVVQNQIPKEASHEPDIALRFDGFGFDANATVEVRRASDGLVIPVVATTRQNHRVLQATLRAPAYTVGVCDIAVTDGDGTRVERPGALDLLGERRASGAVRMVGATHYPAAAAVDSASGRLVVATVEGPDLTFLLIDSATWQVLDTYRPASQIDQMLPQVAYHPLDGTWALTWVEQSNGTQRGFVRITGGADLDDVRSSGMVIEQRWVDLVTAAPDRANGGWHVYWTDASSSLIGRLQLLKYSSAGLPDPLGASTLESDTVGGLYFPGAAQRPDGKFAVVYLATVDGAQTVLGFCRRVVAPDGSQSPGLGRSVCASEDEFALLSAPHVAAHPSDGSVCAAFTYWDGNRLRPATFLMTGATSFAGPVGALAQEGVAPEGFLTALVWNEERGEYVASMQTVDQTVTLRRIGADGKIRTAYSVQTYEGPYGVVFSGLASGSLGLVRHFDGTADGYHSPYVNLYEVRCSMIR